MKPGEYPVAVGRSHGRRDLESPTFRWASIQLSIPSQLRPVEMDLYSTGQIGPKHRIELDRPNIFFCCHTESRFITCIENDCSTVTSTAAASFVSCLRSKEHPIGVNKPRSARTVTATAVTAASILPKRNQGSKHCL